MHPSEDTNKIEELKKGLYSRNAPEVRTRRKLRFDDTTTNVQSSWPRAEESVTETPLNTNYKDNSMSFFKKLFIGSALFCILALGVGAFVLFNGSNLISANNIDVTINGPVSIPGGEPVTFDIEVKNNNNIGLELVDMSVDFPEGAINPDNPSQELKNYRELLGDIKSGGSVKKTIKAIIFGEENLQKQIIVSVTYKVKGSTSIFTKNKSYDILINSSPISVTASSFSEITSNQEFDTKITIKSNSDQVLKNILVKGEYPFGYTFLSSSIKPTFGSNIWKIGDIPPAGERTIILHGVLRGEDSDTRVFRFLVGAQSSADPKVIGTYYMSTQHEMTIQKPFISVAIEIDSDETTKDFATVAGGNSRVKIHWFNNLSTSVSNPEITMKLSGTAYDKASIQPDSGFFRSSDDTLVWNKQTNPELSSLGAGESGSVSFSLRTRDMGTTVSPIVNPFIKLTANITGKRTQQANVPEELSSVAVRNINVSSNLSLTGRTVRNQGPFTNTGPIPPKVDQETSYTIYWAIDNTSNVVSGTRVTATLPIGVKWLGNVNPGTENITYDQSSGTVTWEVGSISTYTVNASRRREVAFQVAIVPSLTMAGQSPTLVGRATLTALDEFTNVRLTDNQDALTTRFSTDSSYHTGDETVVK